MAGRQPFSKFFLSHSHIDNWRKILIAKVPPSLQPSSLEHKLKSSLNAHVRIKVQFNKHKYENK